MVLGALSTYKNPHHTTHTPYYIFFRRFIFYLHCALFGRMFVCRSFECSSQLSPFLQYVGFHIICSTFTLITSPTLRRQTIRRTCFLDSIGWQWPTVWWIRSFTIGWTDAFDITSSAFYASAVFAYGKWIIRSLSKIQCQLNVNQDYVSIWVGSTRCAWITYFFLFQRVENKIQSTPRRNMLHTARKMKHSVSVRPNAEMTPTTGYWLFVDSLYFCHALTLSFGSARIFIWCLFVCPAGAKWQLATEL